MELVSLICQVAHVRVLVASFRSDRVSRPNPSATVWTPALLWLHATSDLFIWLAYISIPLILLYFSRRRDLPFSRLFVLFALFILACGTVHLLRRADTGSFPILPVSWA